MRAEKTKRYFPGLFFFAVSKQTRITIKRDYMMIKLLGTTYKKSDVVS